MSVPSADKVQIYAPSPMANSQTMMLQLSGSSSRRPLLNATDDSKQGEQHSGALSPLSRKFSRTSLQDRRVGDKARRRSSVLSEIGAMVAPLEGDEVIKAAQRANDERAETLLDRMKRWALRPRDIFSLKLFGGGKGISQVYRRGHLPSDASCMILDPKSQGLKRWDVFIMFLLLYTAIVTPYEVGFSEPQLDFWFFLNRFIDLSFLVDLIVNFLTARFDDMEAKWIYKPKDIAIIYVTSWFAIDFVSILPFDVMGLVMESDAVRQFRLLRVVRLLRLLKLARILRASRIFRRWENQINMSYSFMSLIKFMVGVSTISHWMACTWRIIVDIEDASSNWMENYHGIDADGGGKQYVAALYWSVMTITTIGYGDVVARSNGERMLATCCMLLGASIYAYVVGAVCGIVSGLDEATSKFHQTMDQLNVYMAEYRLPKDLQVTLREYFRHCRTLARERYYHDLLVQMSPALRGQVAVFCHSAWILKVPFFNSPSVSDEEREQFIIEIAMAIEPEAYPPNEAIFRVNNPATEMYIVQKGVVAKQGHVLRGGSYFGEDMILKSYKRPYSVRTLTYVDCFRLNKDKLADIIRHDEFPATRIAIRRATIALAFRIKFMTIAKALDAFTTDTPAHRRTPIAALPSRHRLSNAEPVVLPPGEVNASGAVPAAATSSPPGAALMPTSSLRQQSARGASADAGAGDAKHASPARRGFGGSGHVETLSDEEDALIRSRDLVSPHVIAGSGHTASYKQLRPTTNAGPSMKDVLAAVDRRHNQTMEALMLQFNKLTTRVDRMAECIDTIQSRGGRSSCC